VELRGRGYDGIKRLGEIIAAYATLYEHIEDPVVRERIKTRAEYFAAKTRESDFHFIWSDRYTQQEFARNVMSYLSILVNLERMGVEVADYRREAQRVRGRIDRHLSQRGAWQLQVFATQYDYLGWPKLQALQQCILYHGVIDDRVPVIEYTKQQEYEVAHLVFAEFDYGYDRQIDHLDENHLTYLAAVMPALINANIRQRDYDILGELVSSMVYLGWQDHPMVEKAIDFLLDGQNEDGHWGNYETFRLTYDRFVDQEKYLHTTLIVVHALNDYFDGNWTRGYLDISP